MPAERCIFECVKKTVRAGGNRDAPALRADLRPIAPLARGSCDRFARRYAAGGGDFFADERLFFCRIANALLASALPPYKYRFFSLYATQLAKDRHKLPCAANILDKLRKNDTIKYGIIQKLDRIILKKSGKNEKSDAIRL